MSDPYMSQIEAFAFGIVPRNWMQCAGQTLPIAQYQALFSLLGTYYGGDGVRTFQLPDLRGRLAIGFGQGTGLTDRELGEKTGFENEQITLAHMPAQPHSHAVNAINATSGGTNAPSPSVALSAGYVQVATDTPTPFNMYGTLASGDATVQMGQLAPAGGQPHNNMMPYLAVNYCICVNGIFPSRN